MPRLVFFTLTSRQDASFLLKTTFRTAATIFSGVVECSPHAALWPSTAQSRRSTAPGLVRPRHWHRVLGRRVPGQWTNRLQPTGRPGSRRGSHPDRGPSRPSREINNLVTHLTGPETSHPSVRLGSLAPGPGALSSRGPDPPPRLLDPSLRRSPRPIPPAWALASPAVSWAPGPPMGSARPTEESRGAGRPRRVPAGENPGD